MGKQVMKYGARKGKMSAMKRWIAKASARDIRVLPVPGSDILRMHQNKFETDFIIAPNPREANVLLVIGKLTDPLAQKAGVTYQQIPRPRVLVVAGSEQPPHLPEPDVQVALNDDFLEEALPQVRQLLQNYAWSENAEPWEPEFLTALVEDSDKGGGHGQHDHDHGNGDDDDDAHDHHGDDDHGDEDHNDDDGHNHDHNHGADDGDGGHAPGDMDFMSMVAMTKDLPGPKDGLPMNRSEVHFGPFHPGLPGGLSVFMELDGDTVINASVEADLTARSFEAILPAEVNKLPGLLAALNPLTPGTYRVLAHKALENALNEERETSLTSDELVLLETERMGSHFNWLATFAKTVGNDWMHQEAARWQALQRKGEASNEKLLAFLGQIQSMPYLKTKLSVGGIIPKKLLHDLSGPSSKAAGKTEDARSGDELYLSLGWEPVIKQQNSAWGRLLVRLDEIERSLELIKKVDRREVELYETDFSGSGEGSAKLESPRGTVFFKVSIEEGNVQEMQIETSSKPLAALVSVITKEAELSDALVQIASLDISPWEVELKGSEAK